MSAKPRVKCAVCGGACRRMLGTGSGVIFKGSGFYETDYKTRKGGSGDSGSSESKSESKSEPSSKPDTKSDKKSSGKAAKTTTSAD